ncbi:MAG: C39 family peptidase [Candidatus Doudnabacteria bacterium]|nr:C39 family peptidase [Candidatus Doudnabacteria bacterium]
MKLRTRFLLIIALIVAPAAAYLAYENLPVQEIINRVRPAEYEKPTNNTQKPDENGEVTLPEKVILDVPFTSQAPTANWADPRQQDGCEEASLLMAHLWLTGKTMTAQQAEAEIIAMSEYQKKVYGEYVDRSITDTGKLFLDYYNHSNYEIRKDIDADDIKKELAVGNIVIIPTNGQILDNPNYTGAGPITHMLPIIGYDELKKEFITNDPGTRNGKGFRFKYDVIIDSIYDYQTGSHEGYHKTETIMMVVKKDS